MKKITLCFLLFATAAALVVSCSQTETEKTTGETASEVSDSSLVNRGRYLVTIMGCNDCHSSKLVGPHGIIIDTAHMLAGHLAEMPVPAAPSGAEKDWVMFNPTFTAIVGEWGTSFAANLTSDETGIGNWTEAQFFKAIREGKYKGMDNTRPLLPPMPWEMYRNATDDDLRAIFAYLKSTPPVRNVVPAPIPPGNSTASN